MEEKLTVRFTIHWLPYTNTLIAGMCIFALACLLHAKVPCLHSHSKSVLLRTIIRDSQNGLVLSMVLKER